MDDRFTPWVFVRSPLEDWLDIYPQVFDAWEEGGVRGIVIGRMLFYPEIHRFDISPGKFKYLWTARSNPAFQSDPKVFESYGVTPPPVEERDEAKEEKLRNLIDDAAGRGWEIMFFGMGRTGGSRPPEEDPLDVVQYAAAVQDMMNAFPQAHGTIIDGAGETGYELAFHHGGELLEITDYDRMLWARLNFDVARIERGIDHLYEQFHKLTPAKVRYHSRGGMLGGLALFDINEDVLYWLRARQHGAIRYLEGVRKHIDGMNRKVKLGTIPRSAAFSILTSQNYEQTHQYFDYFFPKHYFWHRGFDGMYGTVARWATQIQEWNPSLTEQDCFAAVKLWFGLELPGVTCHADMELGFPEEFFSETVYSETRRALDAVGDPEKVIAWVSSGRHPHGGDPMGGGDLHRILKASRKAGLRRFVYHPDPDLGAAEWKVISRMCGKEWNEDPNGEYWPTDTAKPDTWSAGRERKPRK
jgi:hypothetical protein